MGLLDKLFGKDNKSEQQERAPEAATAVMEPPPCLHLTLTPRWDSVDDMGKEELATAFVCEACHESFTPEQARALREGAVTEKMVGHEEAEASNN
jgi:hypothetical protein